MKYLSEEHKKHLSESIKKWWDLNRQNPGWMERRSAKLRKSVLKWARTHPPPNKGISIHPPRPCRNCGKEFQVPNSTQKFCNRDCFLDFIGKGGWHDLHPGIKNYTNRFLVDTTGHCERCGFVDTRILMVHHVDGKRSNNHKENLMVLCPNCHLTEHLSPGGKLDFRGWHQMSREARVRNRPRKEEAKNG